MDKTTQLKIIRLTTRNSTLQHVRYVEYNNSITPACLSNVSSPFHMGLFPQCANSSALGDDSCLIVVVTSHPIIAAGSAGTLLLSQNKDDITLIVVTGQPIVAGAIAVTRCCSVKTRTTLPSCYFAMAGVEAGGRRRPIIWGNN
jgi:hypothetical protein